LTFNRKLACPIPLARRLEAPAKKNIGANTRRFDDKIPLLYSKILHQLFIVSSFLICQQLNVIIRNTILSSLEPEVDWTYPNMVPTAKRL